MIAISSPKSIQYAGIQEVKVRGYSRLLDQQIVFGHWILGLDRVLADTLNQTCRQIRSLGYGGLEVTMAPVLPPSATDYFQIALFGSLGELEQAENGPVDATLRLDPRGLAELSAEFNHNAEGIPLTIGPEGRGFLFGSNRLDIWIPPTSLSVRSFSRVLTENVAALMEFRRKSPDILPAETSARRERLRSAECEGVVVAVLQGIRSVVSRLSNQKNAAEGSLFCAQKGLDNCLRELAAAQQSLFEATAGQQAKRELIAEQYQTLLHLPKVRNVTVGPQDSILFWTELLTAYDKRSGKTHEIGEFKIELFPKQVQEENRVRWTNQTRTVTAAGRSMYAPHVDADGVPCWGSFRHSLPKAVAEYRISDAIIMAIAMVERVNVNDGYGASVDAWPEARVQ